MISYTKHLHESSLQWVTFVHGAGGSSTIWYKQLKAFKAHFNVLLLDLRGHGNSKSHVKIKYDFATITDDILEVIDFEKIEKSHFVGISLGTILIRNLAEKHPHRVSSMIMGGAIMKLNLRSQILMKTGVLLKSIVPYLWLYKVFAFVIMPNKNHKESRLLFVREAKKLYQKEFIRWLKLSSEINPLLRFFRTVDINIPTLYIMGEEDYLFLPTIKKIAADHASALLVVIEKCGHVVNVERPQIFNDTVLGWLNAKHN